MKKRKSPLIIVRRNLLKSNEQSWIMSKEGATGDIFTCWIVSKSMHIEADLSDNRVASELPFDINSVATDLQLSSISCHLPYVRTVGRINRDRDRNRDNTSTPSVVEDEVAAEGAFLEFWNEIFDNPRGWSPYPPKALSSAVRASNTARTGPISNLCTGLELDLALGFQNSFSKNHPCCHTWYYNQLVNRLIALHGDRPNRHKMSTECHTKVPKICLRGIKTNLRSIALELIFCCFCLPEICSAKVGGMLTETKGTCKYRYNALPVHYDDKTWSRGVSWSHFSTRNDFKKQLSLRHEAQK